MNIILYQPDIALNVGAVIRLCACFAIDLHIIEPCGFPFDERKIKKSALDYIDKITIKRHVSWQEFLEYHAKNHNGKIYLFSTKAKKIYYDAPYQKNDFLLFGSESRGVDDDIWHDIDEAYKIPMRNDCRSLNLATSVAMIIGEANRHC